MSLATRCVACGTIFRVVQDQLKVSEGWVRCGRCDEVFNALESLFDLDREAPPPWSPPQAASTAEPSEGVLLDEQSPLAFRAPPGHPDEPLPGDEDPRTGHVLHGDSRQDPHFEPAEEAFEPVRHDFEPDPAGVVFSPSPALTGRDAEAFDDPDAMSGLPAFEEPMVTAAAEAEAADATESAPMSFTPMPAFVARAERAAKWRQPGRLAGLTALLLLLAVMLAGQAVHHFRDTVAARWPVLREPLARWCAVADCRLGAPSRIEDIVVENTGLTRAVAGTETYRLSVTLRNRGNQSIAMPYVDLTLTDNSGQLVARRALAPADFQSSAGTIASEMAAQTDVPLQVMLTTGNAKVSGYTVEIFYP